MNSYQKLMNIIQRNGTILCVGLDPDLNLMPDHLNHSIAGIDQFNKEIIEATRDIVCGFKVNFAFFEQYGIEGIKLLKKTFEMIPPDVFIIADAKRGDIGNTSAAYAKSVFEYYGADAITVSPYMGYDSVKPFLDFQDKMIFLLALTSNSGSANFQKLESGGKPIYRHVVEKSMQWANSEQIGYVVGATHDEEFREIRSLAENNVLLVPGIGTQGGSLEAILKANDGKPMIINVSRDIIYTSAGEDFAEKAREKALEYNNLMKC